MKRFWITGVVLLAAAAVVFYGETRADSVSFTLPTSNEGTKRVYDRYAMNSTGGRGVWRWSRMGCATRDTCYDLETRRGYRCSGLMQLESYSVEGRPDGVSPYFRTLVVGTAVGLEGNRLTVPLPPLAGTWTIYARTVSRAGVWSCASTAVVRTFQP